MLGAAELSGVKTVYVMPMARSLDQYLASRLASGQVIQVVTDSKRADAIFTDRIGPALDELLQASAPPPAKSSEPEKADNQLAPVGSSSSFGRGKGTIFLVDAQSREVIWSMFAPAKGADAPALDRTAGQIVDRLKRDLKGKK